MRTKLLIFGITGDLSRRKLLPALGHIYATGRFDDLEIIGISRRAVDVKRLLLDTLGDDKLADKIEIITMDLAKSSDYQRLKQQIKLASDEQLLINLAVPPLPAQQIVDFLGEAGLNSDNVKLLFEKPFGFDFASASDVIQRAARYFREEQIYRIDHYLAKEMTQNLVVIRGANAIFENIWNNNFIESIDIFAYETIDIEGRVQFYEQTGALRDVLQGHLMQLLALVLMDTPKGFDWKKLPQMRLDALNHLRPADPSRAVRAQYRGYEQEVSNPNSQTETFVSLELESDAPEWRGVPIRLVTGKALDRKLTEISISLKATDQARGNSIRLQLQPNEGISMDLYVKIPGYSNQVERRTFDLSFAYGERLADAYQQVFVDAIEGRKNLFATSDEILRSWEILEPVQQAWSLHHHTILHYDKGATTETVIAGE